MEEWLVYEGVTSLWRVAHLCKSVTEFLGIELGASDYRSQ